MVRSRGPSDDGTSRLFTATAAGSSRSGAARAASKGHELGGCETPCASSAGGANRNGMTAGAPCRIADRRAVRARTRAALLDGAPAPPPAARASPSRWAANDPPRGAHTGSQCQDLDRCRRVRATQFGIRERLRLGGNRLSGGTASGTSPDSAGSRGLAWSAHSRSPRTRSSVVSSSPASSGKASPIDYSTVLAVRLSAQPRSGRRRCVQPNLSQDDAHLASTPIESPDVRRLGGDGESRA